MEEKASAQNEERSGREEKSLPDHEEGYYGDGGPDPDGHLSAEERAAIVCIL